jgi:hypothetical protein
MTQDEAKEAYRQAWLGWCLATSSSSKQVLEKRMDSLQSSITRGPGPEWQAFVETLPGFVEFWENWRDDTISELESK